VTLLARTWDGPEAPRAFTGLSIVGIEQPAHTILAARDADDDLVLHGERRHRDGITGLVIGNDSIPLHRARLAFRANRLRVNGSDKNEIAENRHAPVHLTACRRAHRQASGGDTSTVDGPVRGVERRHVAGWLRDVHHAATTSGVVSNFCSEFV